MAIKKNAAKADIGPKKQVKATISECKAENPYKCRYHGPKMLQAELDKLFGNGTAKVKKTEKGYEITSDDVSSIYNTVADLLPDAGVSVGYKKAYFILGDGGFVTPDGEAKKEEADTLSPNDAPKNNTVSAERTNGDDIDFDNELSSDLLDNFDDLDGVTAEATEDLEVELLGNSDYNDVLSELSEDENAETELTDEDIKELVAFNGVTESKIDEVDGLMDSYKAIITTGKNPGGNELTDGQKTWWNDLIEKASSANGGDLPALKVLKETMKGIGTLKEREAPESSVQKKEQGQPFTDEEFKEALKNYYDATGHDGDSITDDDLEIWKDGVLYGTKGGTPLVEKNQKILKDWAKQLGDDSPISKAIKETLAKLNSDQYGKKTSKFATSIPGGDAPDDVMSTEELEEKFTKLVDEALDSKMFDKKVFVAKYNKIMAIKDGGDLSTAVNKLEKLVHPPKKAKKGAKEALAEALSGNFETVVSEDMLKPLEHDESKFPQNITQDELENAIAHPVKKLGGNTLGSRLIEIDGKQYVCKAASGTGASVIKNGYNADMAYRAGGVYAPDSKLYTFGDGKVYKLAEYIKGKTLWDVWREADEPTRDKIRKDILKGYPLDVLFSNYDVLGTSPEVINDHEALVIQGPDGSPQKTHVAFDNIIIGDDGHAYRIDNDGSFSMKGNGSPKGANWVWANETDKDGNIVKGPDGKPKKIKVSAIFGKNAKVAHEFYDNWEDREWIDDFRTMRRNERCAGIFDRYSTADIFLSAGNINLDAVVGTLPKGLQKALAKPLFEMKQMTWRAVNISLGGYKDNGFVSMALDASYEASKRGLRDLCAKSVSWNDSGFGEYKSVWGKYSPQPFGEKPPKKPQNPSTALADKLKNEDYTGSKIGSIIFSAAKTINYHGGEKKFDAEGKPIGNPMANPDYKPNALKIADWEKIDREKLEELAKTDANAKVLLGLYDTIAYSKENGWKKPIGLVPSGLTIQRKLADGYLSPTEKKIHEDMKGAMEEYNAKMEVYQKELEEYEKRKAAHKKKEEEKAAAAGGSTYHNFHDFANSMMEEGIDTDGIAHRVQTNGIKPIESSMEAQKGDSYAEDAVKWKVRELMALGFTSEKILDMAENKKLYNWSYYKTCIENNLFTDKDEWDRDMASQAMYLGMNMVKMENEHNDLYDKDSGVVYLNRNIGKIPQGLTEEDEKIYSKTSTTGWVGPHVDSAADCMQFEANWWNKPYKQVYAVPLSRIVCCANNKKSVGGGYGFGKEQEYVGNLYKLPCWVYHEDQGLTWKGAIDEAKKTSGMKGYLAKLASRLGLFNTHAKK